MKGEVKSGTGTNGEEKTEPRFPWLTGKLVDRLVTFAMAATGGLLGAGYMIGTQFTTIDTRITANTTAVKELKTAVANFPGLVRGLKGSNTKQMNKFRGHFDTRLDRIEQSQARAGAIMEGLEKRQEAMDWRARQWLERMKR